MKPHRTDGLSLAFALLFLVIALWWLTARLLDLAPPTVGWLVAGTLILFGTAGLLGAVRSASRSAAGAGVAGPAGVPVSPARPATHDGLALLDGPNPQSQPDLPDLPDLQNQPDLPDLQNQPDLPGLPDLQDLPVVQDRPDPRSGLASPGGADPTEVLPTQPIPGGAGEGEPDDRR